MIFVAENFTSWFVICFWGNSKIWKQINHAHIIKTKLFKD